MTLKRDEKEKYVLLKETLPAPPIADAVKKTIIYHGALYAFPNYTQEQIDSMVKNMEEINKSFKYPRLIRLLGKIDAFRVGPAKKRVPGKQIDKSRFEVEKI